MTALLRWELNGIARRFPVQFAAQVVVAAGFAIGIGFLTDLSDRDTLFLASGAATVAAFVNGLITGAMKPDDYLRSQPVSRGAMATAWLTLAILSGLPGIVVAAAVVAWRYDVALQPGWDALAAIGMGAAIAVLAGRIAGPLIAQLLLLVVIGYAPVSFAPERLPGWLDRLHDWLPFEPMAMVIRAALTPEQATGRAYLILTAWLALLLAITLRRR